MITTTDKLTELQLELLKSFRFITDEKQLKEVKSLLNFYFREKLDTAILKEENSRNYTASVYQKWLDTVNK
ncbi:MAG: hypothetical protein KF845_09165 [Cyclobacteriaceae bacterium]|nr:hypothetical protein [Cyclobacteriaceae bacterium]